MSLSVRDDFTTLTLPALVQASKSHEAKRFEKQ